jgi:hypothetical protein
MLPIDAQKLLLSKEYDGGSIVDIEEDITEAINESDIPVDSYGFARGTFRVVLTFEEYTL